MKKSGKDRLKYVVYESTLSTAVRSPFPNGEGCDTRIPLSPKHSLPREGKAKRTGAERPITICGESVATTLNPEPLNPYTYQPPYIFVLNKGGLSCVLFIKCLTELLAA